MKGTRLDGVICMSLKRFESAARKGDTEAQCYLAYCYANGHAGAEKNQAEAVRLYHLAAEKGNAKAQFNLAWCYEKGEGVDKDLARAAAFYKLAADQGHASAQFNLALCYKHGSGVEANPVEAVRLYSLAAQQGDADAQCNLALCCQHGEGIVKDLDEAIRLYRLASEQGNQVATHNLPLCEKEKAAAKPKKTPTTTGKNTMATMTLAKSKFRKGKKTPPPPLPEEDLPTLSREGSEVIVEGQNHYFKNKSLSSDEQQRLAVTIQASPLIQAAAQQQSLSDSAQLPPPTSPLVHQTPQTSTSFQDPLRPTADPSVRSEKWRQLLHHQFILPGIARDIGIFQLSNCARWASSNNFIPRTYSILDSATKSRLSIVEDSRLIRLLKNCLQEGTVYSNDPETLWFNGIAYTTLTSAMLNTGRLYLSGVKRQQNVLSKAERDRIREERMEKLRQSFQNKQLTPEQLKHIKDALKSEVMHDKITQSDDDHWAWQGGVMIVSSATVFVIATYDDARENAHVCQAKLLKLAAYLTSLGF